MKKAAMVPGWKGTGSEKAFYSDCTANNPMGNGQLSYRSEPSVKTHLAVILLAVVSDIRSS